MSQHGNDNDDEDDANLSFVQDAVSKMSFDDYTFETKTIGYKSRNKGEAPTIVSTDTITKRGGNHPSTVKPKYSRTHGLTKLGLPYLIDRWYDDIPRSRISVQLHLLSGSDFHSLIDVRVSTDRKYLVVTCPLSKNMIEPKEAYNYILKPEYNNLISQENWPVKMIEKLLEKYKKVTARNISVSKMNQRDPKKNIFLKIGSLLVVGLVSPFQTIMVTNSSTEEG